MFNWINAREFSFNSFLLMDSSLIKVIIQNDEKEFCKNLGVALKSNEAVAWYFINKCPECKEKVEYLIKNTDENLSKEDIRKAEEYVIDYVDWAVVYVWPEIMNEKCPYIRDWDSEKLLSMTDFTDKTVLDVGSGTGRLTFAAATKAKIVYSMEPVTRLREFLKNKIEKENISNVVVMDGVVESIPYGDNSFDIVMSGHVVGDDYEKELRELTRVTKPNGYIIDCPGEEDRKNVKIKKELIEAGFSYTHYVSKNGGNVYRYIKKVIK